MTVGQTVLRVPSTFYEQEGAGCKPMRGTVVYVHPKGRFHVVEFEVGGRKARESFYGTAD